MRHNSILINLIGRVVRIGVNEIHVNDCDFFQDITKIGSKFVKEKSFYAGISCPSSSIGLVDPAKHRIRRQILAPAFTQARIQELSSQVEDKVNQLYRRLETLSRSPAPINMPSALKCFTLDIISGIVFGKEFGALASLHFHHTQLDTLRKALQGAWVHRTFPTLSNLSMMLPGWVSETLFPIPLIEFAKVRQFPQPCVHLTDFRCSVLPYPD